MLYDYLTTHEDDELYRYVMIAFHIEKTITENGHVSVSYTHLDVYKRQTLLCPFFVYWEDITY